MRTHYLSSRMYSLRLARERRWFSRTRVEDVISSAWNLLVFLKDATFHNVAAFSLTNLCSRLSAFRPPATHIC